jgi:hypothetical protein
MTENVIAHRSYQGNPNRIRKQALNRLEGRTGNLFTYLAYRRDSEAAGQHLVQVCGDEPLLVSSRDFPAFMTGLEMGIKLAAAVAGEDSTAEALHRLAQATVGAPLAPVEPSQRLAAPKVVCTPAGGRIRIRWNKVPGADRFRVQARNMGVRRPVWELLSVVEDAWGYDWQAVPGLTHEVRVLASNAAGEWADADPSEAVTVTAPDAE